MYLHNRFTGREVRVSITPLNGAHVVKMVGSTTEMHRGNAVTADAYMRRMVEVMPEIWEMRH